MVGSAVLRYDRLYLDMCGQLGLKPAPKWTAGYNHVRSVCFYTSSILVDVLFVEPPIDTPRIRGQEVLNINELDEFSRREIKDELIDFIHENRFNSGQKLANEYFYLLALAFSTK